ncbi:MAG: L-threonylcarbamoyladenylate synthase [Patescibacteria group bacterium]
MKLNNLWDGPHLIKVLKENGVVVMPTDTLYGIVGRAQHESVVHRIYELRKRAPHKPCIILIGDISELGKFGIVPTLEQKKEIEKYRSAFAKGSGETRPTSFILDCLDEKFTYLHRGTKTLAFRLPANTDLQNLLKATGPLIAPSANTEGLPPAQNIQEAKKYFGDSVDLYIDAGEIKGKASKVIRLNKDGLVEVLRP